MVCMSRPYHFNFLKTVFHKFYLVHSWILCPYIPIYILVIWPKSKNKNWDRTRAHLAFELQKLFPQNFMREVTLRYISPQRRFDSFLDIYSEFYLFPENNSVETKSSRATMIVIITFGRKMSFRYFFKLLIKMWELCG